MKQVPPEVLASNDGDHCVVVFACVRNKRSPAEPPIVRAWRLVVRAWRLVIRAWRLAVSELARVVRPPLSVTRVTSGSAEDERYATNAIAEAAATRCAG